MFINELKNEINKKTQLTENGAVGFAHTGKALLDMNFRVSSYRNMSDEKVFSDFMKAYAEDRIMAMRWLFYARDVRGGLGERRLFRVILEGLVKCEPKTAASILSLVAMFGRWDDLFSVLNTDLKINVLKIVMDQINTDLANMAAGKSISLLAKWMPSINCSNKERVAQAYEIAKAFGLSARDYRKAISALRAHLGDAIVERKISAGRWDEVDYEAVCAKANLNLNDAFLRNDEVRRRGFLGSAEKGEAKINGSTNFPHDIVTKYRFGSLDQTLELLWKALPDYGSLENTLVVADGSGSMGSTIGKTKVRALDVANSLAIYFAEHCEGGFKNHYITFSETPQLVNLGEGTLKSKMKIAEDHDEVANTNIQAVFELILKTAIAKNMTQSEIPGTILVLSDMEFDACTSGGGYNWGGNRTERFSRPNATLFAMLAKKFEAAGYKLPKLAFWNVMSRTMTVPMQENEAGVTLISGFSPAAIKMVLCGKADPYQALLEILRDEKYDVVEQAIA